jgi:hypothetical protein
MDVIIENIVNQKLHLTAKLGFGAGKIYIYIASFTSGVNYNILL